ncbi:MAG: flagellar basal body rod protein FlgC [Planctomycetes bacterium]|nr:flagellar basal body rod protein FlgC [Planctomycetota bacterium]
MDLDGIFRGMTVSSSGLAAEAARLDVIAKNIANANVVATPDGDPYRRQDVIFETLLEGYGTTEGVPGEVRVMDTLVDDRTPLREVYDRTHPFADPETGIVKYSNVNMAFEMVDLLTATRAYEANLKAMGAYRDMMRQSLRLLEG